MVINSCDSSRQAHLNQFWFILSCNYLPKLHAFAHLLACSFTWIVFWSHMTPHSQNDTFTLKLIFANFNLRSWVQSRITSSMWSLNLFEGSSAVHISYLFICILRHQIYDIIAAIFWQSRSYVHVLAFTSKLFPFQLRLNGKKIVPFHVLST